MNSGFFKGNSRLFMTACLLLSSQLYVQPSFAGWILELFESFGSAGAAACGYISPEIIEDDQRRLFGSLQNQSPTSGQGEEKSCADKTAYTTRAAPRVESQNAKKAVYHANLGSGLQFPAQASEVAI